VPVSRDYKEALVETGETELARPRTGVMAVHRGLDAAAGFGVAADKIAQIAEVWEKGEILYPNNVLTRISK
jgi:hypothetical protein